MIIQRDIIGNLFAVRIGDNPNLPPIVMGSHLDTQPKGGKFDGIYGVLSVLEVIRTFNKNKITTPQNLEIAVWMNEEGARFSPAMQGSAVRISIPTNRSCWYFCYRINETNGANGRFTSSTNF